MSTSFKGKKTGFDPKGSNDCNPNEFGPPATKFGGRPAVPAGPLKHFPGAVADAGMGNRRLAKAANGDGDGAGVNFVSRTAFGGKSAGKSAGARTYNTSGGKGSGFRMGGKKP